jgi:hypothetical protein
MNRRDEVEASGAAVSSDVELREHSGAFGENKAYRVAVYI